MSMNHYQFKRTYYNALFLICDALSPCLYSVFRLNLMPLKTVLLFRGRTVKRKRPSLRFGKNVRFRVAEGTLTVLI